MAMSDIDRQTRRNKKIQAAGLSKKTIICHEDDHNFLKEKAKELYKNRGIDFK